MTSWSGTCTLTETSASPLHDYVGRRTRVSRRSPYLKNGLKLHSIHFLYGFQCLGDVRRQSVFALGMHCIQLKQVTAQQDVVNLSMELHTQILARSTQGPGILVRVISDESKSWTVQHSSTLLGTLLTLCPQQRSLQDFRKAPAGCLETHTSTMSPYFLNFLASSLQPFSLLADHYEVVHGSSTLSAIEL